MVVGVFAAVEYARCRAGRSLLGDEASGSHTDTTPHFVVACLAWVIGQLLLSAVLGRAEPDQGPDVPPWVQIVGVQGLHLAIALGLLPTVLRSARRPETRTGRLVAIGLLMGVVTYGAVTIVNVGVLELYDWIGREPKLQNLVLTAKGPLDVNVLAVFVTAVATAPFAEEVFFRGTLFPALARAMPVRLALLAQAAVFGMFHVLGDPSRWLLAIPLAVVGWCAGVVYHRTGSILAATSLHAAFNALNLVVIRAAA